MNNLVYYSKYFTIISQLVCYDTLNKIWEIFMKKLAVLIISFLLFTPLFATDYTEMSTQELIAIMGYVKPANQKSFEAELKSRVKDMNKKEKKAYLKNLEIIKKKK